MAESFLPPVTIQITGKAAGALASISQVIDRLGALAEAAKAASEAFDTSMGSMAETAARMGETVDTSTAAAAERMAALGAEARTAGAETAAGMEEAAAGARTAAAETDAAAEGMGSKLLGLGELGSKLKGILPLTLAAVGYESVKMATNFQSSTTRLVTSASEIQSNLGMVRSGLLNMAGQVGVSADDLAKAMYYVEAAGYHAGDGLTVMRAAAQGAAAEGANTTDVARALTDVLVDYHMGASKAADVTSQMVVAISHGKVNLEDFSKSFANIIPAAASAGISFADAGGALAEMTNHGMTAQRASQNLNQALRSLIKPTSTMQDAFKQYGVSTDVLNQKLHGPNGLTDAMEYISQQAAKFGKVDSPEYVAAIRAMMGTAPGMQVALMTTGKYFDETSGTIKAIGGASADAQGKVQGFALVQKNLGQQLKELKAGFDSVMIRIGQGLIPVLSSAISFVESKATPVIHGLSTAISGITAGFEGKVGAAAQPHLTGRAARMQEGAGDVPAPKLTGWQQVGEMLKGVADNFRRFGEDCAKAFHNVEQAAGPVLKVLGGALLLTLQAVGSILANVVGPALKLFTGFLAQNKGLVQTFAEVALGALALKLGTIGTIKAATSVTDLAAKILGFPLGQAGAISKEFGKLKDAAKGVKDAASGLKDAFGKIPWSSIKSGAKTAATGIADAFRAIPWGAIGDGIKSGLSAAWGGIVKGAQGAAGLASKAFQAVPWGAIGDGIVNVFSAAWGGIVKGAQMAMQGVGAAMEFLSANPIVLIVAAIALLVVAFIYCWNHFKGFRDFFKAAWADIVAAAQTAWQWLKGAFDGIVHAAGSVVDWIKGHWPLLLAILTGPIGMAVLLVVKYWGDIKRWFTDGVNAVFAVAGWLARLPGMVWGWMSAMAAKVGDGIMSVVHWFEGLPGKIWSIASSIANDMINAGVNIMIGLYNGLVSMGSWLWNQVMGLIKSVIPGPILHVLGIASPSKWAHWAGQMVGHGLANGILSTQNVVANATRNLAGTVTGNLASSVPALALSGATGASGSYTVPAGPSGVSTSTSAAAAPLGGATVVNHITVQGSVLTERQLRDVVQQQMLQLGARNSQTYQSYRR